MLLCFFSDRCDQGYYGDPTKLGGKCEPCMCDSQGSASPHCNQQTGQCDCIPGVVGIRCDECADSDSTIEDGKCVC